MLIAVVLLRECAPHLPVTALVHAAATGDALHDLGVEVTLSADDLLTHTLAKVLEAPHAGVLLVELLASEQHTLDEVDAQEAQRGRPLSAIREERDDLVVGLVHGDQVSLGIGDDPIVAAGDRLLLARPLRT